MISMKEVLEDKKCGHLIRMREERQHLSRHSYDTVSVHNWAVLAWATILCMFSADKICWLLLVVFGCISAHSRA